MNSVHGPSVLAYFGSLSRQREERDARGQSRSFAVRQIAAPPASTASPVGDLNPSASVSRHRTEEVLVLGKLTEEQRKKSVNVKTNNRPRHSQRVGERHEDKETDILWVLSYIRQTGTRLQR